MNGMIDDAIVDRQALDHDLAQGRPAEAHRLAVVADDADAEHLLAPGLAVVLALTRHQDRRVDERTTR